MSNHEWPNLFIIGGLRCGSTSLWAYLDQHPEIFMSPIKEPNFFTSYKSPLQQSVKDERDYLQLFAGASQRLRGEATAGYYVDPASAGEIKRVSPDAKILLILRDPVERAYSHYVHTVAYGGETRTFAAAMYADIHDPRPERAYLKFGFYAEALRRYIDLFGENVHVLFLEEMQRDPRAVLQGVFRFLEVDASYADQTRLEHQNAAAVARSPLSARLYRSPAMHRIGRALVPTEQREKVKRLLFKKGSSGAMDPETRGLLRQIYEPDRPPLEQLIGRSVPWAEAGA